MIKLNINIKTNRLIFIILIILVYFNIFFRKVKKTIKKPIKKRSLLNLFKNCQRIREPVAKKIYNYYGIKEICSEIDDHFRYVANYYEKKGKLPSWLGIKIDSEGQLIRDPSTHREPTKKDAIFNNVNWTNIAHILKKNKKVLNIREIIETKRYSSIYAEKKKEEEEANKKFSWSAFPPKKVEEKKYNWSVFPPVPVDKKEKKFKLDPSILAQIPKIELHKPTPKQDWNKSDNSKIQRSDVDSVFYKIKKLFPDIYMPDEYHEKPKLDPNKYYNKPDEKMAEFYKQLSKDDPFTLNKIYRLDNDNMLSDVDKVNKISRMSLSELHQPRIAKNTDAIFNDINYTKILNIINSNKHSTLPVDYTKEVGEIKVDARERPDYLKIVTNAAIKLHFNHLERAREEVKTNAAVRRYMVDRKRTFNFYRNNIPRKRKKPMLPPYPIYGPKEIVNFYEDWKIEIRKTYEEDHRDEVYRLIIERLIIMWFLSKDLLAVKDENLRISSTMDEVLRTYWEK